MAVFVIFHKSAGGFRLDNGSSRRTYTLVEMIIKNLHEVFILNYNMGNNCFELFDSSFSMKSKLCFKKLSLPINSEVVFCLNPGLKSINENVQNKLKEMLTYEIKTNYLVIHRYVPDVFLFNKFETSLLDLDDFQEIELKHWIQPLKLLKIVLYWYLAVKAIKINNTRNFVGPTDSVNRYLKFLRLLKFGRFNYNFVHIPNLLIHEDSNCR